MNKVNYYKIKAMVAEMYHSKSGEFLSKKERNYYEKVFTVVGNCKSDALTKAGRQASSQELSVDEFVFV